jgi:hypothetical protein
VTEVDAVKHRSLLACFPHLRRRLYRGTSVRSTTYNCFAWAVGETHRRWDPANPRSSRNYWPTESDSTGLQDAVVAFETVGFHRVTEARARPGWQTIALYAAEDQLTHAARLLENGRWTSKLGPDIDIEHDTLEALGGGLYGEPAVILERPAG